jgi:Raf kinase inhibitor-like YbhB/YbcL family protein
MHVRQPSTKEHEHMGIVDEAVEALGHSIRNVHAGSDKLMSRKLMGQTAPAIAVTSPAFAPLGRLPVSCTVDGAGTPPAIEWIHVPAKTQSMVLACEDPDSPLPEPFVHWIVYGIRASARSLDARTSAALQHGKNSKFATGFLPIAPPPGQGVHHYHFQVFALDSETEIDGLGRSALVDHMEGHVLAWGELVGTYERN